MAIEGDHFGDAGTDEIPGDTAAAAQVENGFRRIDAADKGGVRAQGQIRVAWQAVVDEILPLAGVVDDSAAAKDGGAGAGKEPEADGMGWGIRGDIEHVGAGKSDAAGGGNVEADVAVHIYR